MIDHFRAFKAATGDATWDQVIAATSALVTAQQNTYAPTTGLIADFVVSTNTTSPKPAAANFLEGSTDGQYSYNSVRVPWHLGRRWCGLRQRRQQGAVAKLTAWIKAKVGNDPTKVRAGYKLDGTAAVSYLDPEFVATLGPAAMNDPSNQTWLDAVWNYTAASAAGIRNRHVLRIEFDPAEHDRDEWELLEPSIFCSDDITHADGNPDADRHTNTNADANRHRDADADTNANPSTAGLSVTFRYDEKWSNGWCGSLLVTNNGSTSVSKYTTGFDLPTTVNLSDKWSGTFSRSGTRFTVLSASGEAIAAGQTNSSTGFCVDRLRSSVLKTAVPTNLNAVAR